MRKKIKRLAILMVSPLIVFGGPWLHWLIVKNFQTAFPDMPVDGAHLAAFLATAIAAGISAGVIAAHWE